MTSFSLRGACLAQVLAALALLSGCPKAGPRRTVSPPTASSADCTKPGKMTVTFIDVAQGLSAFVEMPDGRHLLVDTGDSPTRPGCGVVCREKSEHMLDKVRRLLGDQPLDMLWITHQHSDHMGSASEVLERFKVRHYVDNGTELEKAQVKRAREAAAQYGTTVLAVDRPQELPLPMSAALRYTTVMPSSLGGCRNANNCSIGLRIDYCGSSVLFVGDAEAEEERDLDTAPVTLLQVGHHGSDTSSSEDFIGRVQPKYVVISSGKPGEGTNKTYCHPRASTVSRVSAATGATATDTLIAFDAAVSCKGAGEDHWIAVPVTPQVFSTARDGDVTLVTTGDGIFKLEAATGAVQSGP